MGEIDPLRFRRTLGSYPTGVVVVTAAGDEPAGMVVGTFTSVSLDPPLVGFLPDRSSTTWPRIEAAGAFCANVLGADQLPVCKAFASRDGDRWSSCTWRPAPSGSPILDGVVSWVDCSIEDVLEAGDHWFVLGRVQEMAVEREGADPLLFLGGTYGRFEAL